jgi:hypothetical protein
MLDFFKHCFTGADNTTFDVGRVLWALAFLIGMGLSVFSVVTSKPFDLQAFGIGAGMLLAAGAGALKLKESTEPKV